jgi:hypothetical protein
LGASHRAQGSQRLCAPMNNPYAPMTNAMGGIWM